MEGRRFPGIFDTIAGRFDRNPPEYYRMRIDRIDRQGGPKTLNEFDDQAAAYDRIGDDVKAIAIMKAKEARMKSLSDGATSMDWYRFHANIGTFQAHRWLHEGADKKRLQELEQAAKHIEESIVLNPDAHFGREIVQLDVMNWILERSKGETVRTLSNWMVEGNGRAFGEKDAKEIVAGFQGLMVLGAAWESIDVLDALGTLAGYEMDQFVDLRIAELEKAGKKSLTGLTMSQNADKVSQVHRDYFQTIRANAEEFHRNRTQFMLSGLTQGRHPDTDPGFWNGYRETPKPAPLALRTGSWLARRGTGPLLLLATAGLSILAATGLFIRKKFRGR